MYNDFSKLARAIVEIIHGPPDYYTYPWEICTQAMQMPLQVCMEVCYSAGQKNNALPPPDEFCELVLSLISKTYGTDPGK
jgi:hypothetical protein